jgi:hypothetical protein
MAGFHFSNRPELVEALALMCPGSSFRSDMNPETGEYDYENIHWQIQDGVDWTPPPKEAVLAYLEKIQLEWDTKVKYQVLRKDQYPDLNELADAVYHQSQGNNAPMEAYVAKVQAVKDQYPKNDPTLDWRGSASGTTRGAIPLPSFQQNPNISLPTEVYTYQGPGVVVHPDLLPPTV